jgi:hypothetical protein
MESGDIPKNKREQNASADAAGMTACRASTVRQPAAPQSCPVERNRFAVVLG